MARSDSGRAGLAAASRGRSRSAQPSHSAVSSEYPPTLFDDDVAPFLQSFVVAGWIGPMQ